MILLIVLRIALGCISSLDLPYTLNKVRACEPQAGVGSSQRSPLVPVYELNRCGAFFLMQNTRVIFVLRSVF